MPDPNRPRIPMKWLIGEALVVLAVLLWVGIWYANRQAPGPDWPIDPDRLPNFHAIEEGQAYRSAQLDAEQLERAFREYDIKTVINLRGANPDMAWYQTEAATCTRHRVRLINHGMSSEKLPAPDELRALLNTLHEADRPILIHCAGGADRSGAVAALYRMAIMGDPKEHAREELSVKYLHMPGHGEAMDELIERFDPEDRNLDHYARQYAHTARRPAGTNPSPE